MDVQEQRGPFEGWAQAAGNRGIVRFAGKMGIVRGAFFFCFVFFWACKRKWSTIFVMQIKLEFIGTPLDQEGLSKINVIFRLLMQINLNQWPSKYKIPD